MLDGGRYSKVLPEIKQLLYGLLPGFTDRNTFKKLNTFRKFIIAHLLYHTELRSKLCDVNSL